MKENRPDQAEVDPTEGILDTLYKKIIQNYEEWKLRELSGAKQTVVPLVYTPFLETINFCKKKNYAGKVQKYMTDKSGKTHKLGHKRQRRDYYSDRRQQNRYHSNYNTNANNHHSNRRDRFGRSMGSNSSWSVRGERY